MQTDIAIARAAKPKPIAAVAKRLGIPADALLPYGRTIAKIDTPFVEAAGKNRASGGRRGKLILVTAINPTPAGEGKTTTTVGLADALGHIGKQAAVAMREPSLGPCFGVKGGAAGGGFSQVIPMEQINLHFTGDFHAITAANNLLAAMIDNHIYHGNKLDIDPRRVTWRARLRHERPRAARRGDRPRRRRQRLPTRRPSSTSPSPPRSWRCSAWRATSPTCRLACRDDRRPRPRAPPGHRRAAAGGRRDDRAAAGCADAQPRADAGRHAGLHPRRPVRQYRARLQLGHRDEPRARPRRLRGDGGWLRRRPRRREVLRHQVPPRRAWSRRRR